MGRSINYKKIGGKPTADNNVLIYMARFEGETDPVETYLVKQEGTLRFTLAKLDGSKAETFLLVPSETLNEKECFIKGAMGDEILLASKITKNRFSNDPHGSTKYHMDEVPVDEEAIRISTNNFTPEPALPPDDVRMWKFTDTGTALSGTSVAGLEYTVTGDVTETGTVGADNEIQVILNPALTNGETATVIVTNEKGLSSNPVTATAPVAPSAATNFKFSETGDTATGNGQANATAVFSGTVTEEKPVDSTGKFELVINPPKTHGEVLNVVIRDAAGLTSPMVSATAPMQPDAPTDVKFSDKGDKITGKGTANLTVNMTGAVVATMTVPASGDFSYDVNPVLKNGEEVTVWLTNINGLKSDSVQINAPVYPAAPYNLTIASNGGSVSGQAEPNTTITLSNDGETGTTPANGYWNIPLFPYLQNGESVTATATDAKGNTSEPSEPVIAPVFPAEIASAAFNATGDLITGKAEANVLVRVIVGGTLLTSANADAQGDFSIVIDPPLTNGETANISAENDAGNDTNGINITAPVIEPEPPVEG